MPGMGNIMLAICSALAANALLKASSIGLCFGCISCMNCMKAVKSDGLLKPILSLRSCSASSIERPCS